MTKKADKGITDISIFIDDEAHKSGGSLNVGEVGKRVREAAEMSSAIEVEKRAREAAKAVAMIGTSSRIPEMAVNIVHEPRATDALFHPQQPRATDALYELGTVDRDIITGQMEAQKKLERQMQAISQRQDLFPPQPLPPRIDQVHEEQKKTNELLEENNALLKQKEKRAQLIENFQIMAFLFAVIIGIFQITSG